MRIPKRAFLGNGSFGRLAVYRLSFCTSGTGKFLSTPKASTGLSGMWKCIWARKPSFSACSRPSALITALCLSTPLWAEFFLPISPACSTGRPFFLTLLFFAAGGLMALFKVSRIAEINFYLTMPIIGFIIYLLFFSFSAYQSGKLFLGRKFIVQ